MYRLLVIVDAQNDFITGSLGSKTADAAVPNIVSLIQNHEWDNIVCTMDTHGNDYFETLEGKKLPVKHCEQTSPGWCMDSRVLVALGNKYNFYEKDTFGSTDMVNEVYDSLKMKNQEEVEIHICGFCTDVCVMANTVMLRAAMPNTRIVVHSRACAGVTKKAHEAALEIFSSQQIDVEDWV